jgi:hypothetical protein
LTISSDTNEPSTFSPVASRYSTTICAVSGEASGAERTKPSKRNRWIP